MTERPITLAIENGVPPDPTLSNEEMVRWVGMLHTHGILVVSAESTDNLTGFPFGTEYKIIH